jgi:TolB-like protein
LIYRFGDHALDTERFRLTAGGDEIAVEPQVFALLQYLLEHRDRVVGKDEIIEHVWGGRIVSDGTLTSRINSVRRAVGDDGKAQAVIRTLPRRGFQFVAKLDNAAEATAVADQGAALAKPSIAVLPFHNMSGDPEQEYFAEGVAEDIITALSRFRRLAVTGRNVSFANEWRAGGIERIGRELGVRYLLEGSVRKSGNRIRINAQLVEAESGNRVWAERYDRELGEIFEVQDDITRHIAIVVEPAITLAEVERAKASRTQSLSAWDYYLRALPHFHLVTADENAIAMIELEKAIDLDREYVPAIALLSICNVYSVLHGWSASRSASIREAGRLAERAVSIDPTDPAANLALSWYCLYDDQLERGLLAAQTAADQEPNSFLAWCQTGALLAHLCRAEEAYVALQSVQHMSDRDPFRWWWYMNWGNAYFAGGQYDDAVAVLTKGKELRPSWYGFYVIIAASAANAGRLDVARQAAADLLRVLPRASMRGFERHATFARQSVVDALLRGLRKAGVPEA